MSNIQRLSLLGLAAVVLVVGYFVLRPDDDGSGSTTVTQTAPPTTTDATGGATATAGAPAQTTETPDTPPRARIQTITVRDGQPVGGLKELEFHKGDTIAFKVTANAPGGEVHLHGYDIAKDIPASGGSVTYQVPAKIEGIFDVEMEATGVHIAKVVVQP